MGATRQVLITGIGVVSPIGIGNDAFLKSLQNGTSGISQISQFDATSLPVTFGAELRDFDPKKRVRPRKSLKVMCREIQTAFAAADLAMNHAELTDFDLPRERIGTVFGSELLYGDVMEYVDIVRRCSEDGEFDNKQFGQKFVGAMTPLWMLKYLPNMPACHVAIAQDARGPNNSIVMGEASSLLAMIEAANLIRRGVIDIAICGGTGSRLSVTGWLYRGDRHLSHWKGDPQHASRPFDANRDGSVCGEGSACFVLESEEFANRRNAKSFGRLAGHGATVDVGSTDESRQLAIANSIHVALNAAEVSPQDVSHVNAHGLGTKFSDEVEAKAIRQTLDDTLVTATKSFFGDLGAGSGAVELAASLLSMDAGMIPQTLNYQYPDTECPVNVVSESTNVSNQKNVVALNQSKTGQAAAVIIESHGS